MDLAKKQIINSKKLNESERIYLNKYANDLINYSILYGDIARKKETEIFIVNTYDISLSLKENFPLKISYKAQED